MRLTVFSHKLCWPARNSPSGYATDGGFPFQMQALSELFDETRLVVPCDATSDREGGVSLTGNELKVVPLSNPAGSDLRRKLGLPFWFLRNGPALVREALRADGIHAPVPGDIGTLGMILASVLGKPLFVRHCGNWFIQQTAAERFWKWFMEMFAGGRNLMLATGGAPRPPSERNRHVRWIFSTSLTERELSQDSPRRAKKNGDQVRLIIVARQERAKGTGVVIRSLPRILAEFPHATLDVVGDGGALPEFRKLTAALGLDRHVTFHGKLNHDGVMRLLRAADVFCFPTTSSEGFPKVVVEALACGVPVVTTKVSVLPQLIGAGCGVLLDAVTPEALAAAVTWCLTDPGRYRRLSEQAVMTAGQYSLERWGGSIGAMLRAAWGPLKSNA